MKRAILLFISFIVISQLNISAEDIDYTSMIQPGRWLKNITVKTEFMKESGIANIQIYFPKDYVKGKKLRTIIALHQSNRNENDWESSGVESFANTYNMVIVCPNMKRSVYENSFYPETTYKWNVIPGSKFLGETLIKFLNKNFSLALKRDSTGIMGIEAGAHGAILTPCYYPNRFKAAAGIAGYYDPPVIHEKYIKMIESVYGRYEDFKDRWENDANPLKLAERLKGVHIYLFHGLKWDSYQPEQSRVMAIKIKQLQKKSSDYSITYKENKTGSKGWGYWRNQVPDVMAFMNENLSE
ncbi:MAG: esterase family protein [Leptospirales bacterium]|nr:esterase family protein [Leptospirales bacterium]